MKVIVIGGGIFGCNTAYFLSKEKKFDVTLIEKESSLLSKASKHNHNRIHLGYHYLRSIKTAKQSIEGLNSLMQHYGKAIIYQFPNYYAIANQNSKTTVSQFESYCNKVGIDFEKENTGNEIINKKHIDCCYKVPEPVFDFDKLFKLVNINIKYGNINVRLNTSCKSIEKKSNKFLVNINGKDEEYDIVINCTYTHLNNLHKSFIPTNTQIEYIYEDVILPIFEYKMPMIGLTIMDGDFCSIMPKGLNENKFLLYHVKHSILRRQKSRLYPFKEVKYNIKDKIELIKSESEKFYPFLKNVKIVDYWRETRVVTGNVDDERLTEINSYPNHKGYYSIFSGKITTCVKTALEIKEKIMNDFSI